MGLVRDLAQRAYARRGSELQADEEQEQTDRADDAQPDEPGPAAGGSEDAQAPSELPSADEIPGAPGHQDDRPDKIEGGKYKCNEPMIEEANLATY